MKKFKITKLQLTQLLKNNEEGNEQLVSADLRAWFPDAFKKELEVGKWYKGSIDFESLIFITEIEKVGKEDRNRIYYYGWLHNEYFREKDYIANKDHENSLIEATLQEIESALICEANKRGFEDKISFNELEDSENGSIFTEGARVGSCFYFENNKLYTTGWGKWCVFKDGQWAQIIETITIQEAEKLLNKKIV